MTGATDRNRANELGGGQSTAAKRSAGTIGGNGTSALAGRYATERLSALCRPMLCGRLATRGEIYVSFYLLRE